MEKGLHAIIHRSVKSTCVANSLVGKRTRTLGALPYPVFLVDFAGPFVNASNIGSTKAKVFP